MFTIYEIQRTHHQIIVLVTDQESPKGLYSSGIKTSDWRKTVSNPTTHQNYSKVVVHNKPNSAGHYVITKTQETQKIYPVYNAHSYGGRPENNQRILQSQSHTGIIIDDISRNNKAIYKRKVEYKSLEVYEKCPTGETGQFVYAFSCNQYLNCWKGRGAPQNCAPGTLFNPKTLECDFPDKVECVTGPRQNSLGNSIRVPKSVHQANCPEGFSGLIPNYTDCSKFISCNDGNSMPMDCPPGTLFDTSQNICDHPNKCTCFDGKSGTEVRVQNSQESQYTEGSFSQSSGCGQSAGNCGNQHPSSQNIGSQSQFRPSLGNQQLHQFQYDSHRQSPSTNSQQSSSGFQFYPGTGLNAQGNSQSNVFSVTTNRTGCNPQNQNCEGLGQGQLTVNPSGSQQFYQTQYGSHRQGVGTNLQQSGPGFPLPSGNNQQNIFSVTYNRTNCNPQYQNCGPNQGQGQSNYPSGTTSGNQQFHQTHYESHLHNGNTNPQQISSGARFNPVSSDVDSQVGSQHRCNPQFQNCGFSQASDQGQTTIHTQYVHSGNIGENRYPSSGRPSTYGQVYPSGNQDNSDVRPSTFEQGSTIYAGCNPQTQRCDQNVGQGTPYVQTTIYSSNNDLGYGQENRENSSLDLIRGQSNPNTGYGQVQTHRCNPGDRRCGERIPIQVNQNPGYGQATVYSYTPGEKCNPLIHNCRPIPVQGSSSQDRYDQTNIIHENCNPLKQNCGQGSQAQNSFGYGQTTSGDCCGQSTTEANTRRAGENCNPATRNCGPNSPNSEGNIQSHHTGQFPCDPRVQYCGESSQNVAIQQGSSQVNCDLSSPNCGQSFDQQQTTHGGGQSQTNSNYEFNNGGRNYKKICSLKDRNCQTHSIVAKDTRDGEEKCPGDFQGIMKHPFDCSKFLNCANGQTFIQDCAPGTLFNQKLGNCDFPYNVECDNSGGRDNSGSSISGDWVREYEEHVQQFSQNPGHGSFRPTTESQDPHDRPGSQRNQGQKIVTDINIGEIGVVSRPPHARSTERPSRVDDVDVFDPKENSKLSSTPRSVWPPPFPKTNEIDYEFDYEDGEPVTLEPEDVFYAEEKKSPVCEEDDFHCSSELCITQTMVCDGHRDCPDGKDELLCEEYISRFSVHKNSQLVVMEKQRWINASYATCAMLCIQNTKFTCRSFNYRKIDRTCFLSDQNIGLTGALRNYIPMDYYELKAGTVDCSNQEKYFECYNRKCIMKEQLCDGADDCGDRQDEKSCKAEEFGYSIKLTGSKERNEGRVEVTAFGRSGYICDDKFGIVDANVVCRELGFVLGAAEVKGQSHFAKDLKEKDTQYMMDEIECVGNETSLLDCGFAGWGIHDCTDQEIVGVVCKTPQENCGKGYWKCDTGSECVSYDFVCDGVNDCSDDSDERDNYCEAPTDIRLVNGSNSAEGRLEIKHHGIWGTVCDDDFNEDAAKVVCRHFGYKGMVVVKKDGYFGAGDGPIWLDQVSCYGNETTLETCTHWNWGEHNCEHSEDVGVICTDEMDEVEVQRNSKLPARYEAGLPKSCGYRKDNQFLHNDLIHARVIAGSVAKEGDYPWQAALKVRVKDKSAHWCGAVIISSKWVLTAAHCLQGYTKGAYVIVAGEYDTDTDSGAEQRKFIDEFFVHERFRQGHKMNNDIALVKVKGGGFVLNDDVQPICLPDPDADYERRLNCTISGFGSVKSGTSAYSHKLMAAWIPIHSRDICKMPHIYGDSIADGMICAGFLDGGVDACDGDSGGPLACLDQGVFTLYGLTSWGQHCGHANKPGVYVKVAHYRAWIEDIIQKHSQ
ncbi:unnamed protein product [Phaedon cochleariae]|uniref:Uncharacterized protein n=1 Tax=Phaedon cochleariae TaxID=80249 RepID=A0A9N9SD97_PHACE|nr:unnamed protein product [Phaedon cochleariae]